jgi:hypothetical protein
MLESSDLVAGLLFVIYPRPNSVREIGKLLTFRWIGVGVCVLGASLFPDCSGGFIVLDKESE